MTGQQDIYTGSDTFSIVVNHYGDAKGTRNQFSNSDPSAIDGLIRENISAYHLATETLAPQLAQIKSDLEACWAGSSADNALGIVGVLANDATTIGTNTKACGDSFTNFQTTWVGLKSQAGGLYEGVAGTGVNQDNDGAHRIYKAFNDSMQTSMRAMPSHLSYDQPLSDVTAGKPGPSSGSPGGPGGPGGYGPGGYGPGSPGPGGFGPGGLVGPGGPGPGGPGPGPGGFGPGLGTMPVGIATPNRALTKNSGDTAGPGGAGLDTGSTLAGYTDGGMGGGPGAAGPGAFGPGPGPGATTLASSAAGLSGGIGPGAAGLTGGIAGVGADEAGAGTGRGMMGSRGGGGGSDDEDERDRSTWLSEEEGIWDGDSDVPPGTIA